MTAIIDYGVGNLFSVRQACATVGLEALITGTPRDLAGANALILPGVGAFGDAMANLRRSGMDSAIREFAASGKPLLGICLGMQLLVEEGFEFGHHRGLGVVGGAVVHLKELTTDGRGLKFPHIGWNRIQAVDGRWEASLLKGVAPGEHMYFVHSFAVVPEEVDILVSTTNYGGIEFCSTIQHRNIFACQYHPERSGREGLKVYRALAGMLEGEKGEKVRKLESEKVRK